MKAVLQRVLEAEVKVSGEIVAKIGPGLLVYLGVEKGDSNDDMIYVAEKIIKLRIFPDQEEKMQFPITEIAGSILIVSQFTLCADLSGGNRPSFVKAAEPDLAKELYNSMINYIVGKGIRVETGVFAFHMYVSSVNDGPVTIMIDSIK